MIINEDYSMTVPYLASHAALLITGLILPTHHPK